MSVTLLTRGHTPGASKFIAAYASVAWARGQFDAKKPSPAKNGFPCATANRWHAAAHCARFSSRPLCMLGASWRVC